MTFAVLRALHAIIGDAIDDIQRFYASPYASPPPSPSAPVHDTAALDFPSLDAPYDPTSPAELMASQPEVMAAINRIIAAAGQLSATVQTPFLSLCDASMAYHLPSCMRLLEASHTVEILRAAGPQGLHVKLIAEHNGVEASKLAHILRLLCTHHILRELSPDVFTLNRISSLVDSRKSIAQLKAFERDGRPELKYQDTDGIAAFVGLCTDELAKSSAYLTEAYLLSPSPRTRCARDPTRAPFCFAFGCASGDDLNPSDPDHDENGIGFFGWLEGGAGGSGLGAETGQGSIYPPAKFGRGERYPPSPTSPDGLGRAGFDDKSHSTSPLQKGESPNRFRLERFGKAMGGTPSWEAPGAVLNGFDWAALPRGSIVVDVGGGIGSTSMLLAQAFGGLRFVIQDRAVVVEMGEKAWRDKCPELLDSGTARFQVHDFFNPQPIKDAAVFLLRVVLHDWPDAFARRILLRLRESAGVETKLVLADFVLPLACADDIGCGSEEIDGVEGAERMLAPAPLLANLGKASANAYWMDLTMQVTFNGQERTLREIVALAASAGWRVVKVTRPVGTLFGYIVAVPAVIPRDEKGVKGDNAHPLPGKETSSMRVGEREMVERSSSRCGTPTFGSRTELPSSVEEAMARFGGGVVRSRGPWGTMMSARAGKPQPAAAVAVPALKQAVVLVPPVKKKKPSPLSVLPLPSSPSPSASSSSPANTYFPVVSPRQLQPPPPPPLSPVVRMSAQTPLYRQQSLPLSQPGAASVSSMTPRQHPPPSPVTPRHSHSYHALSRRASHAQLSSPTAPFPSSIPVRQVLDQPPSPLPTTTGSFPRTPVPPAGGSRHPTITRRSSYAHLPQTSVRARSGSVVGPLMSAGGGCGGAQGRGGLLLNGGGGGVLSFVRDRGDDDDAGGGGKGEGRSPPPPSRAGGTVLAAAARIERGVPRVPSP